MRRLILCSMLAAITIAAAGCAQTPALHRFDYAQVIMGVRVNIAAYSEDEVKARDAARDAFAEMSRVDAALSDYRPDSEAMRLCDAAGTGPVPVSDLLAEVLRRSLEFSQASEGAFDVTSGPLVLLWRQARREGKLPDPSALAAARALVGWRLVSVHLAPGHPPTAALASPGMRLDFGGIGKGFAADRGMAVMRKSGVSCCLVAAAGDIAVGEPPPDRPGWRIEMADASPVAAPADATSGAAQPALSGANGAPAGVSLPRAFIEVSRCGVSTSGDTEQHVDIDGVRYSHIVDPRTGLGVTRRVIVTTVAPDAASADAAATALCVLAPERRAAFLRRFPDITACVRLADQPGFEESVTRGFPTILRDP